LVCAPLSPRVRQANKPSKLCSRCGGLRNSSPRLATDKRASLVAPRPRPASAPPRPPAHLPSSPRVSIPRAAARPCVLSRLVAPHRITHHEPTRLHLHPPTPTPRPGGLLSCPSLSCPHRGCLHTHGDATPSKSLPRARASRTTTAHRFRTPAAEH
jgi:hypothetical protein